MSRFLAVLAIFVFGFSMQIVALNQPIKILNNQKALNDYFRVLRNHKPFDEGNAMSVGWIQSSRAVNSRTVEVFLNVCF